MTRSVYHWFSCHLGPHSAWRARRASAVSSRLPAFLPGAVPASCCGHCPHPALRVEAGSFWHQPWLWPVRLPTKEHRPHQVRQCRESKLSMYKFSLNWSFHILGTICFFFLVSLLKPQVLSLQVFIHGLRFQSLLYTFSALLRLCTKYTNTSFYL